MTGSINRSNSFEEVKANAFAHALRYKLGINKQSTICDEVCDEVTCDPSVHVLYSKYSISSKYMYC